MSNPKTSKAAYDILSANAARLSVGDEVDIDELVPLVAASTKAYSVCKERLDAVEKALQEAFKEGGKVEQSATPVITVSSANKDAALPSDDLLEDDDVPF